MGRCTSQALLATPLGAFAPLPDVEGRATETGRRQMRAPDSFRRTRNAFSVKRGETVRRRRRASEERPTVAPDTRFLELVARYGDYLRRTTARISRPESGVSCDDIVQEALFSLWTALRCEREIEFPPSYIHKVAVSATIRAIRRARARREEPLPEEGQLLISQAVPAVHPSADASPEALVQRTEMRQLINRALSNLPAKRRIAVKLYLQEFTTSEIAKLCGWTEPKARNLVYRGRENLQQSLRALGIEYNG
jgi:RNA polymerase sigma factor (sigma-70 family)